MSEYHDLAALLEASIPGPFQQLKQAHPNTGRLFASSKVLGGSEVVQSTPEAQTAARDYAELGLGTLKRRAQSLIDRLAARIRTARNVKLGGALLAMFSSAGVAAAALEFISLDQRLASLGLSGLAFVGAATSAFSDRFSQGAGHADASSLLHDLANVRGDIGRAEFALGTAKASNGHAVSYFDVLKALNDCAYALDKIEPLTPGRP